MKKHFFKRLLTVIIAFVVIFLLGFILIIITPGNAALGILYLMIYIICYSCSYFRADFGFNNFV